MVSSRVLLLSVLAMVAFAANSVLCRLALGGGLIDAASFASVRTFFGAVVLALLVIIYGGRLQPFSASWATAIALFVYMVFFSFAYLTLETGTGALILFGTVQLSMLGFALWSGERLSPLAWVGTVLAGGGLVYLVLPGLSAPDPVGASMMVAAALGWAVYSIVGKGAQDPLAATASNFIIALPLTFLVSVLFLQDMQVSGEGILLAAISGAIASACGYAIWYAVLPHLTTSRASILQLSVSVLAAFGGVIFLSEEITWRLLIASVVILGGVALVVKQRTR